MYSLNPKGGFSTQVGLRFSKETYGKMKEVCAKKEISVSVFIRMALIDRFAESEFLRNTYSWGWVVKNYANILAGAYRDFPKRQGKKTQEEIIEHEYSKQEYNLMFEDPDKRDLF